MDTTYAELCSLSNALVIAAEGGLLSREEAKIMFRDGLIKAGLKIVKVGLVKKEMEVKK